MNAPLFSLTLAHLAVRVTPLFLVGMVAALVLALDATLMIFAPTRRDALPRWLRVPGVLIPSRYDNSEIRLAGLLVLGMLSWVIYDMLTRPH